MNRRKFLIFMNSIAIFFALSGCRFARSSSTENTEYPIEALEPISEETQSGIEAAFREEFGVDITWCRPMETDHFDTYDELDRYVKSNNGMRCYGRFGDSYLLCRFSGEIGAIYTTGFSSLTFGSAIDQNVLLTNQTCWYIRWTGATYLYDSGELRMISNLSDGQSCDFSKALPGITYEEALIIPRRHKAYTDRYFGKFMIEGETNPNQALSRIRNEISQNLS